MEAILLLLGICVGLCSGANILGIFPLPAFSHTNSFIPIFEELARRGHNVTVVSPFPRKKPLANYTDVYIPASMEEFMESIAKSGRKIDPHEKSFIFNLLGIGIFCPAFEELVMKKPEVLTFISEDRSHFDAVITESFFCQESLTALSHKYSAHLIGISPYELGSLEAYYTGNTVPYSYVPNMRLPSTDHMSFIDRLMSSIYYTADVLLHLYFYVPMKERFMKENFKFPGSENLPPLDTILKNHSLMMVDGHFSLGYPRPYHQNVVGFGGLTTKKAPPLPKDLEEYMSGAEDGVIFLSWGSHYRSTNMKPETLAKFLSVFSKLKQRVLMKWEDPELPGKPDNVKIAPWFPQTSILSHPKLVAFISHCGSHGLAEATYNGLPILGTPIFGDQYYSAKFVENAGYGIILDIDSFSEQYLLESLQKLIYNPSYKEAALRRSKVMKDRPRPALDNAVYWIEYVLRHNGARHLRPASLDLPWYQYFLLDIIALVLLIFLAVLFVFISLCRIICCRTITLKSPRKQKDD